MRSLDLLPLRPKWHFLDLFVLQVYLLKVLQSNRDLLEEIRYLRQILDMLTLVKMAAHLTHESLALKFHYLSCVLEHAGEAMKKTGNLDALIKRYSSRSLINWLLWCICNTFWTSTHCLHAVWAQPSHSYLEVTTLNN